MDISNHVHEINVSGKIYHIKHSILKKIPYFHEYINEFINNNETKCFVQRSSHIFDHVLSLVIDHLHPYPSEYFYELDFYGITYQRLIYKVNVLGKIYHLKREILEKIPYFVNIINKVDHNSDVIYVDRSSLLFEQVLSYVMDKNYPIYCYDELKYYGIIYNLCDLPQNEISKISNKLDKIQSNIDLIDNKVNNLNRKTKQCMYDDCEHLIDMTSDSNYCDNHNKCRYCYEYAYKSNNYLCQFHDYHL